MPFTDDDVSQPRPTVGQRLRDIGFKALNTGVAVAVAGAIALLQSPDEVGDLWWAPMGVVALNALWAYLRQVLGDYVPPTAETVAPMASVATTPSGRT
jgi:hypothetical protein